MLFIALFSISTSINTVSLFQDTSKWQAVPENHGVPLTIFYDWWWGVKSDSFGGMGWRFNPEALAIDAVSWYLVASAMVYFYEKRKE